METKKTRARSSPRYVMAMVLGTALSALGAPPATASTATPQVSARAITNISRYCTTCWRNARLPADRWNDCTQEVLSRLLERVAPEDWDGLLTGDGEERREFLRAIDAVKKRSQRDLKRSTNLAGVVADPRDGYERSTAEERQAVNQAADELLTSRQQKILQLSFEGWSVQDMARTLDLPAERISDEKYKAVRKLREHFCSIERG